MKYFLLCDVPIYHFCHCFMGVIAVETVMHIAHKIASSVAQGARDPRGDYMAMLAVGLENTLKTVLVKYHISIAFLRQITHAV